MTTWRQLPPGHQTINVLEQDGKSIGFVISCPITHIAFTDNPVIELGPHGTLVQAKKAVEQYYERGSQHD